MNKTVQKQSVLGPHGQKCPHCRRHKRPFTHRCGEPVRRTRIIGCVVHDNRCPKCPTKPWEFTGGVTA